MEPPRTVTMRGARARLIHGGKAKDMTGRVWAPLLVGLISVGACGDGGKEDSDNDSADGSKTDTDDIILGDGDGDGDSFASPEDEGGTRPITPEEAEQLESGACAGWAAEPEPLPSSIMLVVDVSSSMNSTTDATGGRTKWEVTRDALQAAIDDLPASVTLGMVMYPNKNTEAVRNDTAKDASECVETGAIVPFENLGAPGSDHRERITDLFDNATLHSSTPTHDAYATALEVVRDANLPGNTFMLLITDGQPTLARGCIGEPSLSPPSPPEPIIAEIADAFDDGIRTFLIGSPGSEENVGTGDDSRWWLSEAAEAGGTSLGGDCSHDGVPYCHFDMVEEDDFSAALGAALANIAGQVVSCEYTLPEPPEGKELDLQNINLVLTPANGEESILVLRDAAGSSCDEGWYMSGDQEVVMCEDTCDDVLSTIGSSIKIHFGCEPLPPGTVK